MNVHKIIGFGVAVGFLATGGMAAAQSTGTGTPMGSMGSQGGVSASLDAAPSVPAGARNVALANIGFDPTGFGGPVNISNVPLTVTSSGGASAVDLVNCHIENAALGMPISNAYPIVDGAQTSFALSTPFPVVGAPSMLAFVCDVAPATPVGSVFDIAIAPQDFHAVNVSGAPITIIQNINVSGAVAVSAPTTTPTSGVSPVSAVAPGIPNTGAGGTAAATLLTLLASAAIGLAGAKRYLALR